MRLVFAVCRAPCSSVAVTQTQITSEQKRQHLVESVLRCSSDFTRVLLNFASRPSITAVTINRITRDNCNPVSYRTGAAPWAAAATPSSAAHTDLSLGLLTGSPRGNNPTETFCSSHQNTAESFFASSSINADFSVFWC